MIKSVCLRLELRSGIGNLPVDELFEDDARHPGDSVRGGKTFGGVGSSRLSSDSELGSIIH